MVVSNECISKSLLSGQSDERDDDCFNDEDDVLSLCDLPIYSSSSSNSDSFSSLNRYEYQEEANNEFDFFSRELDVSNHPDDDAIIFCGKLIGRKDVVDQKLSLKPKKKSIWFSWKRFKIASFRKSASKDNRQMLHKTGSDLSKKTSSSKKVSTLVTCPTKSKWYLFMFGQTRFPQALTMDLSDLKNRQQRRLCFPSGSMNLRAKECGGSGSGRGGGIWSQLKESVTSVGKMNSNAVVRAVGRMSLV